MADPRERETGKRAGVERVGPDRESVWVFNGARSPFPSAVFRTRAAAEAWIGAHRLSGTLTAYPLDIGAYEHAIAAGIFAPKRDEQRTASFIANFSSASFPHVHYVEGRADDAPP